MADNKIDNVKLEEAKLYVLATFVQEAINALTSETIHVEVIKHYIQKTTMCLTFEDFNVMVDELAISAGQEHSIKKHLSQGQLHGQK